MLMFTSIHTHRLSLSHTCYAKFTLQRWHRSPSAVAFGCLYTDCLMLLRGGLNALTAVTTVYFDIGAEVGMQYQICMQYFSKLTFALIPFSIHFYQLLAHIFTHGIS